MRTVIVHIVATLAVFGAVCRCCRAGQGLVGGVGLGQPDEKRTDDPPGRGKPATTQPSTSPAARKPPASGRLEEQIRLLRRKVPEMQKVRLADIRADEAFDDARQRLQKLQQHLNEARKKFAVSNAAEAKRIGDRKKAFAKAWADLAGPIEKDTKPDGTAPAAWAGLCDRYFAEKADLAADVAKTEQRLRRKRSPELAALEEAVRQAEDHSRRMQDHEKAMAPDPRTLLRRRAIWRAHQAELLAARRALGRLEAIQAERKGARSKRAGLVEEEVLKLTGYWMADTLRVQVGREIDLSGMHKPPAPADLDAGLRLPEWMRLRDMPTLKQAICDWLVEQLRLTNLALRNLEKDIDREDRGELEFLRAFGYSRQVIQAEAKALDESRPKRIAAARQQLNSQRSYWQRQIKTAAAELEKMKSTAPATRPGR